MVLVPRCAHFTHAALVGQNGVGLRSKTYSRGVFVDLTPPECVVIDGSRGRPDFNFSTEGVPRVYVSCTDIESGAYRVRWGLGTIRGWDDHIRMDEASVVGLPVPPHLDNKYSETQSEYHKSPYRLMDSELASLSTTLLDGVRYVAGDWSLRCRWHHSRVRQMLCAGTTVSSTLRTVPEASCGTRQTARCTIRARRFSITPLM